MIETNRSRSPSLRFVGMLLFCSLCAIALAPSASADTVYTYTGNPFTFFDPPDGCFAGIGECQISLSFTLASPLPASFGLGFGGNVTAVTPLSFSFTDGVHTLTQLNSLDGGLPFLIGTGPNGQIDAWDIHESSLQGFGLGTTDSLLFPAITGDSTNTFSPNILAGASNSGNPGTWTISTVPAVPEPSSLMLLGTGLLGMLGLRRKRLA